LQGWPSAGLAGAAGCSWITSYTRRSVAGAGRCEARNSGLMRRDFEA
jgi:hypothetical protein